uniref:Uncharacterized protein n=1 Tax=Solanum tuberosum TaxID=4113 RepID=M1BHZ9_SOLTU
MVLTKGLNEIGKDQKTPDLIAVGVTDGLDLRSVTQSTVRRLGPLTDRGSNEGPCWSTVVHVKGWVKEISIHGDIPRTVGLSVSRDLANFSELVWGGVALVDHQHGPWSDIRSVDGDPLSPDVTIDQLFDVPMCATSWKRSNEDYELIKFSFRGGIETKKFVHATTIYMEVQFC